MDLVVWIKHVLMWFDMCTYVVHFTYIDKLVNVRMNIPRDLMFAYGNVKQHLKKNFCSAFALRFVYVFAWFKFVQFLEFVQLVYY